MSAKPKAKRSVNKTGKASTGSWQRLLLVLSLVPVALGIFLILAWALDWELIGSLDNQIVVGTLFILGGFALSNLGQKKYRLAAGWACLMVADALVLVGQPWLLVAGAVAGLAGLILIGIEFYQRMRAGAG